MALFEREGRGPLTSGFCEGGAFIRTRSGLEAPDIQLHFGGGASVREATDPLIPNDGFTIFPTLLAPTSRGRVTLRNALPHAKPRIQHNYYMTEDDTRTIIDGTRIALEIASRPALTKLRTADWAVPESDSDADILRFVRLNTRTIFHPVGTCAMGAVVDAELRVQGVESLRVADASVMPTVPRGNTNAPTIMVAEKAADLIRGLPPPRATAPEVSAGLVARGRRRLRGLEPNGHADVSVGRMAAGARAARRADPATPARAGTPACWCGRCVPCDLQSRRRSYRGGALMIRSPFPDVEIPDVPFTAFVLARAGELGDKPPLIDAPTGRTITYAQLADSVRAVAAGLGERGFGRGDVFALSPERPSTRSLFTPWRRSAAVNTTANPLLTTDELADQLRDCRARLLLTAPEQLEKATAAAKQAGVEEIFVYGEADGATPFATLLATPGAPPEVAIDPPTISSRCRTPAAPRACPRA